MADDDDRDDRDDDDDDDEEEVVKVEKRPAAAKPAAKKQVKLDPVEEQLALIREIRDIVSAAHERQDRYLWLLLPVIAILLVIAIFQVIKL